MEDATSLAGVPGLLVHGLRRTGARKLRGLGVDRDTIMRIGGWKTDSVFRRYNVVDERDLQGAADALDQKPSQLRHTERKPEKPQTTAGKGVYSPFSADSGSAAGMAGSAGNDRPTQGNSAGAD